MFSFIIAFILIFGGAGFVTSFLFYAFHKDFREWSDKKAEEYRREAALKKRPKKIFRSEPWHYYGD